MRFRYFFLYVTYGITAFLFFLVFLFPKDRAATILCEKINAGLAYGQLVIESVVPVFPPGLKAINPVLILHDGNKIEMELIELYPEILSIWKDVKKIDIRAEGYSGKVYGSVELGVLPSKSKSERSSSGSVSIPSSRSAKNIDPYDMAFTMHFENIHVKGLKSYVENIEVVSSFVANANLDYRGYYKKLEQEFYKNIETGSGNGNIKLSECTVQSDNILIKQMGVGEIKFTRIDAEFNKDYDIVNIADLNAQGPDMKIGLKGDLILKAPVEESILNFKGAFQPDSAYISSLSGLASLAMLFSDSAKKGIPFNVTGTLKKPRVTTSP